MPVVGLLLGLAGAGVMVGVDAGGSGGPRRLLGAALAVGLIALLTGGLHLDGLADTADGLGSRRAPADALAIMRRSDVGPMGVAALVLVLLVQVTAVAAMPRVSLAAASLVLAEVTGRVAVVVATGSPAARPGGFGALVAGRTSAAGQDAGRRAARLRHRGRRARVGRCGTGGSRAGRPPSSACWPAGCSSWWRGDGLAG